jgi:hypothetical protein
MPTQLPDMAARARHRRRRLLAELTPIVAALLYLLLFAWNVAALEANVSVLFGRDPSAGEHNPEYNPMEPGHRTADGPHLPTGWRAQR